MIDASPLIRARRGGGTTEAALRSVESVVGPLSPSYRWWLTEYGHGTVGGAGIATVTPDDGYGDLAEDLVRGLDGNRLRFHTEHDCGDTFAFVLDGPGVGGEHPVVRYDHFTGAEEPVAESFAGFLTVRAALAAGLRDGPTPALARLWRHTPGVLLPNGVLVHGPHSVVERNETYEVAAHAPHWVLIGDDSGGGGLFSRRHGRDRESVYRLGLGALSADSDIDETGELVTGNLLEWLGAGGALPGSSAKRG